MIAVLFMIIMMCCIGTSFTVYAAGEWTVDGDAKDYVYIPGGTYWGGSTSRTGALLYCVDKETKKIVPNTITLLANTDDLIDDDGKCCKYRLVSACCTVIECMLSGVLVHTFRCIVH